MKLEKISVDYVNHMGSDLTVVDSARVSFDKTSSFDEDGFLKDKDVKLINYLANHGHWTPFSHPQITLRETVPIFVARQRFKHMVGFTYNEISRRYVDSEPAFFEPEGWRLRPEGGLKQGSSEEVFEGAFRTKEDSGVDSSTEEVYKQEMEACLEFYNELLNKGVAPEQARMVLPQSMMTSYFVTGSLSAFARLYRQRADSHAQKEIQDLALKVGKIIQPLFPVSWEALTKSSK